MITRRTFLASALASSGLAKQIRLNIGIGAFSYHNLSLDDMIVQLRELKINEIEMSRGEFMLMNAPTAAMCEAARRKLDAAGIRCVSYYTATIKNARDLDTAVQFARIFGARNVSGDATGPVLNEIDQRFSREYLTFGIHNHWFKQKFAYESVEDVLGALKELSKTVGATLDVGQMAACGHDPVDAVRRLAPYLKLVHLKDVESAGAEHNVLLGTGVANIPGVMRELKRIRYDGLVAIEYEKEGEANEDMRKEIDYARRLAGWLPCA
ncbi:MAG TPA: sugar phosphate isomerase/epimerase family protein [Bryobacteraceae bacterium]